MSNTPQHDVDHLAYPEPPASPLWHHRGAPARPLTEADQKRNCQFLVLALRTPRPRTPHTTNTPAEAR
ncbi:hypothetical protein [Streptomyces sp. NPDC047525]|uniref:hypothetical protein n=1 Tax=Streptomyces sp. NPDC047525 TaxID=3155264 RepID=UPI00340C46A1